MPVVNYNLILTIPFHAPPNKDGKVKILNPSGQLKKLIAQIDIIQSNSMVEAANKLLKYSFLYPK